jgi:nitroimidazol reductase NimA-like FMN-containing flavoprotein (pyridoxamine 5'-phosphate oxidase superfamily)
MPTWKQFAKERPDLAASGRRLLYAHGIGLGFLATVRPDGGPRVHPICPVFTDDDLYAFITPGPKLNDLRRDGRYALCSETCPPPNYDDNVYITGQAIELDDRELWDKISAQTLAERNMTDPWPEFDNQGLFQLTLETCLVTLTLPGEVLPAGHSVWKAQSPVAS